MILQDIILQILKRLDRLEERYWQLSLEGDIKACNGLEHCIELRMRLFGFDGKNSVDLPSAQSAIIDLDRLSESTLGELITNARQVADASLGIQYWDPINSTVIPVSD